jgi:serine/threonine-protein phosphatase CPPED1
VARIAFPASAAAGSFPEAMTSPRFRFVFLADTQLGCYATFSGLDDQQIASYAERGLTVRKAPPTKGYEWDAERYRRAVAAINVLRPAFVLVGGDLVDDPNSDDQTDEFLSITDTIDDDITVYLVPGNHDIAPDAVTPTPASVARYRDRFGPDFYAFTHDGTRVVVMNTTVIDHPEFVVEEWEAQRAFLEEELTARRDARINQVVLAGHHPLFLDSAEEPDTYWNLPLQRRKEILALARRAGVTIGFAGHWHRNHLSTSSGFTQVVSGPVGYPLGDDPSGYRIVDVDDGDIEHRYVPLDAD